MCAFLSMGFCVFLHKTEHLYKKYLKNRYVAALIKNNKIDKAFTYAVEHFKEYKTYTVDDQGTYLFYNLVALDNSEVFEKAEVVPPGFLNLNVSGEMIQKYLKIHKEFIRGRDRYIRLLLQGRLEKPCRCRSAAQDVGQKRYGRMAQPLLRAQHVGVFYIMPRIRSAKGSIVSLPSLISISTSSTLLTLYFLPTSII